MRVPVVRQQARTGIHNNISNNNMHDIVPLLRGRLPTNQ